MLNRGCVVLIFCFLVLTHLSVGVFGQETDWRMTLAPARSTSEPLIARFSPDSKLLAIGCKDGSIRLWSLESGQEVRRLIGPNIDVDGHVTSIAFSPDGKRIISCTKDAYPISPIRVWSVATGELLFEHTSKKDFATAVTFHPQDDFFAAEIQKIDFAGSIGAATVETFSSKTFKPLEHLSTLPYGYTGRLKFSPDGRFLVFGETGLKELGAKLLNLRNGKVSEFQKGVYKLVFSPSGNLAAGITESLEVVVLDAISGAEIRRFAVPQTEIGTPLGREFRQVLFGTVENSIVATTDKYWLELDVPSGQLNCFHQLHSRAEGHIELSPDGNQLVEVAGYYETILWNRKSGEPVARLHCVRASNQWAIETPSGYYQHSEDVKPTLKGMPRSQDSNAFIERYRNSVMVSRLLGGMSLEDAERLPENNCPPTISIRIQDTQQDFATIAVEASATTSEAVLRQVDVAIDGRIWRESHAGEKSPQVAGLVVPTTAKTDWHKKQKFEIKVPFPAGSNAAKIQGIATDTLGQEATSRTLTIVRPVPVAPVPGRLFVLAVGVSEYDDPSLKLQFSHADAEELAATLLMQKGLAFGDVQVQVYVNKQATVTNLKEGLAWLQRSCTASDVAVILFSGHGVQKERGLYYVTHEANLNGVQYTCLNWETVAETLSNTKARQILFLTDVCHAGSFAKSDLIPQQELATKLQQKAGVMVFASSRGDEKSLELKVWGHGAFVRSLLDGLDGKADLNGDGNITIAELQKSITAQVIQMTGDRQHPELPDLGRYAPDLVIAKIAR